MQLNARDRTLSLEVPRVMGILNVTPDSFSDGGKYQRIADAIDHTANMLDAGASIIDIGGESTRPGAHAISDEEEATRVVPIVAALTKRFDTFISVDTSKALVMRESVAAGAHLINDIRALREPGALMTAAASNLPICLMHMHGDIGSMHKVPLYKNLISEVIAFFEQQIAFCESAGISKNRLILDPGFGFGKNLEHNYLLLSRLGDFYHFGLPLLVGMSRKSMIGKLLNLPPEQLISGSVACAVIAAMQGAKIIRVHDVRQTVEAMRIVENTLIVRKNYFQ